MSVATNESSPEADCRGFLPIALDTLCPTPVLDFDLYMRADETTSVILYRERNYPLDHEDLNRLSERGVRTLYIPSASHTAYRRYLFDEVIPNKDVAPVQRYQVLKTAARSVFDAVIRSVNTDHMVEFADDFGRHMTDIICHEDLVLSDLFSLMEHDYYTYTHAANVCTCCLVLADRLGIHREADLLAIASGALMHDIGKRSIPPTLLNKPGRLDPQEREIMQQHPQKGFEDLCLRNDLAWSQLMMVYQHHERLDGRGYPVGLTDEDIHAWARICAVADVFDAMSSNRPYRKAIRVSEVLEFLEQRGGTDFDKEMVRCWIAAIRCRN